ncbi:MAG TPA: GNAT family N-acetyltransferase [Vicinamibacterales bacterium]|nr:GNAT family N-acetyltransferase [Vicinamibacterales bacterium]
MIRVVLEGPGSYRAILTPPHTERRPTAEYGPMRAGALCDALRDAGCHTTDIADAMHEADPDWLAGAPDRLALPPPWMEYPDIPYPSIGWRMGDGEAYMDRWVEAFDAMAESDVEAYMRQHPEPPLWNGFYARHDSQHRASDGMMRGAVQLVWPARVYLSGYVDALKRGWSPDNERGEEAALEQLAKIDADADAFLASLVDREAKGGRIPLPDGTTVERLPGYNRWLWDGEFCGVIGFRWARGNRGAGAPGVVTEALPPHCLGHIGYSVVPWKRGRGYATQALRELLPDAKAEGLKYVELVTDHDNVVSQRVIEANGGVRIEEFIKPAVYGNNKRGFRYRVQLA